jgi:hypothetical protein
VKPNKPLTAVYESDTLAEEGSGTLKEFPGMGFAPPVGMSGVMMSRVLIAFSVAAVFSGPSFAAFAACDESPVLNRENSGEIQSIYQSLKEQASITCIEDLGKTFDAPQFVIKIDQGIGSAHLTRTGGAWAKEQDYGVAPVRISTDTRGFAPSTIVRSYDTATGRLTNELDLKITGSIGIATVRMDGPTGSTFKTLNFRCE